MAVLGRSRVDWIPSGAPAGCHRRRIASGQPASRDGGSFSYAWEFASTRKPSEAILPPMNTPAATGSPAHQVIYFPYLGLTRGEELRFGQLEVWSASRLTERVASENIRTRVRELLDSHRAPAGRLGKARPLKGIGVVSRGASDLAPLIPEWATEIQELRQALFLAGLSNNVGLQGENAGHWMYTSRELLVRRRRDSPSTVRTLARRPARSSASTCSGIGSARLSFRLPRDIPRPAVFRHDEELFTALDRLRTEDPRRYRRVLDAASVFLESYYNTPDVDVRARILLQAAAFEILLELPDGGARKAFKDEVERYCCRAKERRYRYKYESRGKLKPDTRTQKGIWADRFFTLRNHMIHGERVADQEYRYRGVQHHVHAAAIFFVQLVKCMWRRAWLSA